MIEAYLKRLAERRGEVTAEIIVAQKLTPPREAALAEQLRRAVGARVTLDIRVDPALLGGMIVKIGSRMVDASLNSRLQRLRLAMKATG
jgi:F-type H+-transporting ATPase subunit delta